MGTWEDQVLAGDFSAIPFPFRWTESARFAHLLDGYDEAGGTAELARLANGMLELRLMTGRWTGDARQLWMCLFFMHRRARNSGHEPVGSDLAALDELCGQLRRELQTLAPKQARTLVNLLKAE